MPKNKFAILDGINLKHLASWMFQLRQEGKRGTDLYDALRTLSDGARKLKAIKRKETNAQNRVVRTHSIGKYRRGADSSDTTSGVSVESGT